MGYVGGENFSKCPKCKRVANILIYHWGASNGYSMCHACGLHMSFERKGRYDPDGYLTTFVPDVSYTDTSIIIPNRKKLTDRQWDAIMDIDIRGVFDHDRDDKVFTKPFTHYCTG